MATEHGSVDLVDADVVQSFVRAALLAALTGALAYVAIPYPLSPAPITLQVLGVFLAGLYLGPLWGGVSMVLYVVAGAMGAPVFALGTAGPGVLLGQTGGYIWSYPLAAPVVGLVVHRGTEARDLSATSLPVLAGALGAATLVVYAFGVVWMAWVLSLEYLESIVIGAAVFVPAELVKMGAAIAIVRRGPDIVSR